MSIALKLKVKELTQRVEQMEKKLRHEFPEHRKVAGVSDPDPVPVSKKVEGDEA